MGSGGGADIQGTVYDVAMEQARNRDWVLSRVAVQEPSKGFRRRGQTHTVEWRDVEGLARREETQGATHLIATLSEMRPADAANVIHELPRERLPAVVAAMDDERLADVLEELPEEDQVEILELLDRERAADVLEEMSADDAADLIADLHPDTAATLLGLMEPDEAEDVRRLMSYADKTAGAMMTPEPVILSPDATIADALAHVRNPELTPVLAALVYVCRSRSRRPPGASSAPPTSSDCCASRRRRWSPRPSTSRWTPCAPTRRSTRWRRTWRRTTSSPLLSSTRRGACSAR